MVTETPGSAGQDRVTDSAATTCAFEGCNRPGAMRVAGTHLLPGQEQPLAAETLICLEHAREFSGGHYSMGLWEDAVMSADGAPERVAAIERELRSSARYELADFHPETGHRHHCENPASCDCAAWLYALAQHAEEALWSIRAGTTAGTNPTTSGAAHAASTTGHPSAPSTPKDDPSGRTASPGNPVPTGWAVVRRDVFDRAYPATP